MFDQNSINLLVLKERAYNLRWATVPADVIPLTAADPDFKSAPEIAEAIANYASDRYLCYGPPEGLPAFRESVARSYQKKRDVPAEPERVIAVDSAAFGIFLICQTFLKTGDEAIVFDPVDFLFKYSVEACGAKAVPFPIPQGSEVDFEYLEGLITKRTRMICLCNPINPTGKVFTKEELQRLGDIAVKNDLIILSDEIWSDIVYKPHVYTSIAALEGEIRNRTVIVTGYSKSYGLAGLRIGSVIAMNDEHFKMLFEASRHQFTVHGANVLGQVAAMTALNKCERWLGDFVEHLQVVRDLCVSELNQMKGIKCLAPEGCYVAFADIKGTGLSAVAIQELLFEKAKVAVVPGSARWFGEGAEGYIRLSFATSEDILKDALMRIKNTINAI
jgi:aminotransferase